MLITAGNLCHYLIAKGMISKESVVDGDFAVIDVSGRNRNFKVIGRRNASYFVKQIQQWDAQTVAMLQCEAVCYWLARNDADFAPLAVVMPEFLSYDLERHILITGLIPESENLFEVFRRVGNFPTVVAAKLGEILATYHRVGKDELKDSPHTSIFPKQVPWILAADRRNSHPFKELSHATSELFELVEKSTELRQSLEELRTDWRATTLIHGDMRLENCILSRGSEHDPTGRLKIVDWELADIGDPGWDVGSIMQAFFCSWIMFLPTTSADGPTTYPLDPSNPMFAGVRATIRSLWDGYTAVTRIESKELLWRCIRYAAARMIQSAYEYVQFSPQVSSKAAYLLQVSSEILKEPGRQPSTWLI